MYNDEDEFDPELELLDTLSIDDIIHDFDVQDEYGPLDDIDVDDDDYEEYAWYMKNLPGYDEVEFEIAGKPYGPYERVLQKKLAKKEAKVKYTDGLYHVEPELTMFKVVNVYGETCVDKHGGVVGSEAYCTGYCEQLNLTPEGGVVTNLI